MLSSVNGAFDRGIEIQTVFSISSNLEVHEVLYSLLHYICVTASVRLRVTFQSTIFLMLFLYSKKYAPSLVILVVNVCDKHCHNAENRKLTCCRYVAADGFVQYDALLCIKLPNSIHIYSNET